MNNIRQAIIESYEYKPKKKYTPHRELNCIQLCLSIIAKIFKCDYEYIFLEAWEFDLSREEEKGDDYSTVNIKYNEKSIELICKYTDLQCEKKIGDNSDTISKIDENCLALAEIDTFHCPWSPGYKDSHFTYYFFMFVGEDGKIDSFGPYDNTDKIELTDEIINNIRNIYLFSIKENSGKKITNLDIKYHIDKSINQHGNQFDNIIRFADNIEIYMSKRNIFNNREYNHNRILQRIVYVELSRKTVRILFEKFINTTEIMKLIDEIVSKWTIIKNIIIKIMCYENIDDIKKAKELLKEVVEKEKLLYSKISEKMLLEKMK